MNLYQYLENAQKDFDTCDTEYNAIVTVCHIGKENDNYDKFCNELVKKVEVIDCIDNYLIVNWSELIEENFLKFREFTNRHWNKNCQYEDDDAEFTYQWIKEIHYYLAGYVSMKFYDILINFINTLTSVTIENKN